MYVLCCTVGVGVCVVLYTRCRYMCHTSSVGVCVMLYIVYVLYIMMGQAGMGIFGPLFLILRVEAV